MKECRSTLQSCVSTDLHTLSSSVPPCLVPDKVTKQKGNWLKFSLSVDGRDNIIHEKYSAFVLIKYHAHSSYRVMEHAGPTNQNASIQSEV